MLKKRDMGLFVWNSSYSVNVERFDAHHKQLIDLINTLFEAMKAGQGKEAVQETLEEMKKYSLYHFNAEEAMMKLHNYINYQTHKEQHQFFISQIDVFKKRLHSNNPNIAIETFDFLKQWLIEHIKVSDKQYTTFFNALGVD